jgi:toxin ParE1/3/4
MSVSYSARALADLVAISSYIYEHRPSGVSTVMRRIEATVALIERHPGVGSRVRARSGVYALPVSKYPYRIYYRVNDQDSIIVHIRHAARKSPRTDEVA